MSARLEQARKDIEMVYKDNNLTALMEAMEIVKKYEGATGESIRDSSIDELQADTVRLVSLNFYLQTLASNLDSDAQKAVNVRKFQDASIFCQEKEKDPKMTLGHLEKVAEVGIASYRQAECEAQRRAMIMKQTCVAVQEQVNVLKKVVERLMWQGPSSTL